MSTAALFQLAEVSSEVFAFDAARNSEDLGGDPSSAPALVIPETVVSLTGRGRLFGADIGLRGSELVANSLRLSRDFTARGFMQYRIDNALDGDVGTIVSRGRGGSASERLLFAVSIERVDASTARIFARWEEIGGTAAAGIVGASFQPDPEEFFGFAVVRRWIDTTTVELTYVVNDIEIGTETVAAGNIGEGTGGTLAIGCIGDGVGNYSDYLPEDSIIDQLSIEDDAMTFEEIRQEFRRITIHQPNGFRILRSYFPPGESWSKDPASAIMRWIAAEGDAIGYAIAQAAKLREDHMPDRAYGAALEAWENLVGLTVKPLALISERRDAVIAALRRVLGFGVPDLKTALEPLFGLTSAQILITEFSALREDDFSFDDITPATPSNLWRDIPGNGALAIGSSSCSANIAGGSPNCLWPTEPGGGNPPRRETSVTGGLGAEPDGSVIIIDVDGQSGATGNDVVAGLYMRNPAGDVVIFGVSTGDLELQAYSVIDGVRSSVASLPPTTGEERLFLRSVGAGLFEVGTITAGVPTVISSSIAGPLGVRWAGFGTISRDAGSNAFDADFRLAQIHEPKSPRGHAFIAYRDPGLPGVYNLEKAQAQLDKQAPAASRPLVTDQDPHILRLGASGRLGVDFLMPRIP